MLSDKMEEGSQHKKEDPPEDPDEKKFADDIKIMSRINLPKLLVEQHRGVRQARPSLPKADKVRGWFTQSCKYNNIESLLVQIIMVWLIWAMCWSFLQNDALPGSYVFAIAILTSLSYFVGAVVTAFTNFLPGHFMIGLGILARHTFLPQMKDVEDFYPITMDYTKRMAYVVFLLRAGLGTNLIHIKHYSTTTLSLICIPFLIESMYISVVAKYALGIQWVWAAMVGVMIAPSSLVNVFTTSSRLRRSGYSPHNAIHSVMIFSSIITSLIALCFVVSLISKGWWGVSLILIPGQILIGSVLGIVIGFIGIYVPSNNNVHADIYRCLYFVTSSIFFIFILNNEKYRGASFIAAYISPLVATNGWKHFNYYASVVRMRDVTSLLWSWTQPFWYALMGAGIDLRYLGESRRLVFIGVHCSLFLVNFGASILATLNSAFSWKHRLLLWFGRISKGTIEVAVSPWILVAAKENFPGNGKQLDQARLIIDCCVLAFAISGPLGGCLMDMVGKKVLQNINRPDPSKSQNLGDEETDETVNFPSKEKKREARLSDRIL